MVNSELSACEICLRGDSEMFACEVCLCGALWPQLNFHVKLARGAEYGLRCSQFSSEQHFFFHPSGGG